MKCPKCNTRLITNSTKQDKQGFTVRYKFCKKCQTKYVTVELMRDKFKKYQHKEELLQKINDMLVEDSI